MLSNSLIALALVLLTDAVQAQQSAWGQCGGIGWTGATSCVSGYYCAVQNSYYSQCIPGTASSTLTTRVSTTSAATSTTSVKTTISSKTSTSAPASTTTGVKYLISFGDSYSQTGFDITGTKPSLSNPLGNPAFPGYTTTNGPNWLGYYITQFNTTPVYSYNLASGGATTDATIVAPYEPTVLSLIDQTTLFSNNLAAHPSYAPWTSTNALFAIWIGVNDVGNIYWSSTFNTTASTIMDRYFAQAQTMYAAGARKFLFLTVPPTYLTPNFIAQGATVQAELKTAIATYNADIAARAASFKAANSGVTAYVLDTTTPFLTALNNPTAYGAPDATCYDASGTACLWWNDYHPGQAIQKLVAQAMAKLLGNW